MPTPPPTPLQPPKTPQQALAREEAVKLVDEILHGAYSFAYGTRRHMPNGLDFTDFVTASDKVRQFFAARPDWAAIIVAEAVKKIAPQGGLLGMAASVDEGARRLRDAA